MTRKVVGYIELQIPVGEVIPVSPVGPAFGQHGVNTVQSTKEFNTRTVDQGDLIIPVVITVYVNRGSSFTTGTPPAAVSSKKARRLRTASAVPNKNKVATTSKAELQKIVELKMSDLNAANVEVAMNMIASTTRGMGITVKDQVPGSIPVKEMIDS